MASADKEQVGANAAYVILLTPKVGLATMSDVKHNAEIDDSSFSRPAGQ